MLTNTEGVMELVERSAVRNTCPLYFKKDSLFSQEKSFGEISSFYKIPESLLISDSSNGCGIGTNSKMAKRSAVNELIERHTILKCLMDELAPQETSYNIQPYRLPPKFNIKFYFWTFGKSYISIAMMIHPVKGFYFGTACAHTLKESLHKAFLELVPSFIYSYSIETEKEDFQIVKNDVSSFGRYWRFSGDERLVNFFQSKKNHNKKIEPLKEIFVGKLNIPEDINHSFGGLHSYRAISPNAQQLFFDNWSDCYINKRAIHLVAFPDFPHFIN